MFHLRVIIENLIEAVKHENLEAKIMIVGNLPEFTSLTDIPQEDISSSEIDDESTSVVPIDDARDIAMICCSSDAKGTELSYTFFYNNIIPIGKNI